MRRKVRPSGGTAPSPRRPMDTASRHEPAGDVPYLLRLRCSPLKEVWDRCGPEVASNACKEVSLRRGCALLWDRRCRHR